MVEPFSCSCLGARWLFSGLLTQSITGRAKKTWTRLCVPGTEPLGRQGAGRSACGCERLAGAALRAPGPRPRGTCLFRGCFAATATPAPRQPGGRRCVPASSSSAGRGHSPARAFSAGRFRLRPHCLRRAQGGLGLLPRAGFREFVGVTWRCRGISQDGCPFQSTRLPRCQPRAVLSPRPRSDTRSRGARVLRFLSFSAILGPLHLHLNFRLSLSTSRK